MWKVDFFLPPFKTEQDKNNHGWRCHRHPHDCYYILVDADYYILYSCTYTNMIINIWNGIYRFIIIIVVSIAIIMIFSVT